MFLKDQLVRHIFSNIISVCVTRKAKIREESTKRSRIKNCQHTTLKNPVLTVNEEENFLSQFGTIRSA